MPLYRYRALTEVGKRVHGVIDADTLLLAKERLRREKILVTALEILKDRGKEHRLDHSMLLAFTRELEQLLNAGLPLYEGLLTIEEKYRRHRAHPLLLSLCDRLKGGLAFSATLAQYPKTFDPIYLSMIEAGEKTGSLPWVFSQLRQLIERKQKLKKQLLSALAYPLFLGGFCLIVISSLLLFVIPSMRELFEDRPLHPLTCIVLGASQFLEQYGLWLLVFLVSLVALCCFYFRKEGGKRLLNRLFFQLPLLKTLLLEASLIRFCRSASTLLFGGVPLLQALGIARQTMDSPLLEEVIERAEVRIKEGESFSEPLKTSPLIPPLMHRMLALAEETGKMAPMMQHIADIYDGELEKNLTTITTFLQPALLILLGGIVGLVILSILIPLSDMGSFTN